MRLRPTSAQYLLRFDDLCPTMDRGRWERFRELIERFGLRPILAVVPDNRDQELERELPDPDFWEEMRRLEAAGATIGLHGYRHLCRANGPSLIPMHDSTEFAGAALELQREWIADGLRILREQGLRPAIFVAPRHGLDVGTLRVLREEGIGMVSDGFADGPFREHGQVWIPQQIWGAVAKSSGLWTICVHANSAADGDVVALEGFLERFAAQFTSLDRVVGEWPIAERCISDRWFHGWMVSRIRLAKLKRRLRTG
jgi:hypothetical protein